MSAVEGAWHSNREFSGNTSTLKLAIEFASRLNYSGGAMLLRPAVQLIRFRA